MDGERRIVKPCPEPDCKGTLVIRTNGKTGEDFLGCDEYPRCRHTEEIPIHLELEASGFKRLPGF